LNYLIIAKKKKEEEEEEEKTINGQNGLQLAGKKETIILTCSISVRIRFSRVLLEAAACCRYVAGMSLSASVKLCVFIFLRQDFFATRRAMMYNFFQTLSLQVKWTLNSE
jgi:hypothetical protein